MHASRILFPLQLTYTLAPRQAPIHWLQPPISLILGDVTQKLDAKQKTPGKRSRYCRGCRHHALACGIQSSCRRAEQSRH